MLVRESLNEFMRGADPKKALDIGPTRTTKSKAWKILEFIGSKGEEGASFTEIQLYIWTELQGYSEKDFWEKDDKTRGGSWKDWAGVPLRGLRSSRGYYATNLYGSGYFTGGRGLLHNYCHRNEKRKWVLDRMPDRKERIY
jgi:hypothetical protein